MKRYKHIFEEIYSLENLHLAYLKARKGKQSKPAVEAFTFHLESELLKLQQELSSETYVPGPYRQFHVYESKKRLISAAPFRDRVVHHAICNVIEPIFEATFIYDSYACRVGKGTHAAVQRFREFLKCCSGAKPPNNTSYVLKCDIARYFPSIDHQILLELLGRKIADERVIQLLSVIIKHSPIEKHELKLLSHDVRAMTEQAGTPAEAYGSTEKHEPVWFPGDDLLAPLRPHGLPIGNQTSQFFANVYLNPFDHFVKETLREKYYLRYVDDFLVLGNDKTRLHEVKVAMKEFLLGLRLRLHENKTQLFPATEGTDFLGYRIFPTHLRVRKSNVHRFKRRLKRLQTAYASGEITLGDVENSVRSWLAHATHADSYQLRRQLMSQAAFKK
jgi:retron-type reverse transcriptase